jgi:hypothetical protein
MLGIVQDAYPDMISASQVINHAQTISIQGIDCYRSNFCPVNQTCGRRNQGLTDSLG